LVRKRAAAVVLGALLAAAALAQAPPVKPTPAPPVLPFVEDDYPAALEKARAQDRPLFVEAWAPWCHTCRSMRAFVFTDRALAPRAGEFVWLSIDTEKKGSAAFLAKFPVEAWPTFFVIDPKTERAAMRWIGGATVPQLQRILDDGRRLVARAGHGADELLARADALYAEKRHAEAAAAYRRALAKAQGNWPSYPRAVESLLFALRRAEDRGGCAAAARDAFPRLASSPSAANVAGSGLDCALSLPASDPRRAGLVAELAEDSRRVVASRRPDLAADDVSSLYGTMADERESAGDDAGRRRVLEDWSAFLEGEASRAKSPTERTVFDSHRLSVYLELGQPDRAIAMLKQSEKDFPDDYNPPARLALAYEAAKDYEMALRASDRALSKAYGPRLVTILTARAKIHREAGDVASARVALEEAAREAEALPPGQRSERQIAAVRKMLDDLPAPASR
jgi:tetratricopeptide (TPR) repeat protein